MPLETDAIVADYALARIVSGDGAAAGDALPASALSVLVQRDSLNPVNDSPSTPASNAQYSNKKGPHAAPSACCPQGGAFCLGTARRQKNPALFLIGGRRFLHAAGRRLHCDALAQPGGELGFADGAVGQSQVLRIKIQIIRL